MHYHGTDWIVIYHINCNLNTLKRNVINLKHIYFEIVNVYIYVSVHLKYVKGQIKQLEDVKCVI